MYNEHGLQFIISVSMECEGMDIDDLHSNTHCSRGYNEDHPITEMI